MRLRRCVKHSLWYDLECVDYYEVPPDGPPRPPPGPEPDQTGPDVPGANVGDGKGNPAE